MKNCINYMSSITNTDSINLCLEKIGSSDNYYSDDSLKIRFNDYSLLNIPFSSFKRANGDVTVPYDSLYSDFSTIKNLVNKDSIFVYQSLPDSTVTFLNKYNLSDESVTGDEAEKLINLMKLYDNIIPISSNQEKDKDNQDQKDFDFERLNIEEMDLDKLNIFNK